MKAGSDPSNHHDWHSVAYVEDWIDRDVTRDHQRQPLLDRLAMLIPSAGSAALHVLDVGGGYGVLTAAILARRPGATVVLHDFSTAMVGKARERLAGFGDRVGYRIADMAQPGWVQELGGPFDAAVSALAIHNLADPELIGRVYGDIFSVLRPEGCFFNLDLVFPTGSRLADLYRSDRSRDAAYGVQVGRIGLEEQLRLLREAGFAEVDCVWKDLDQGLLWGFRRGDQSMEP